ncbi:uncharacterized protein LOC100621751 [Sus scrofa]|uniref:uncharacterized protein LOC100621751 n=1 Tax=Sus scrofa TaxID=9823 RepID=UPI000A2B1934|nr:uncharacterized protein LOC100621751 [Sus scrofa]
MPAAARRAAGAQAAGGGLRRHRARRAPTTLSTSPLLAPALPGHLPPPAPRSRSAGQRRTGGRGQEDASGSPPRARQLFPVAATEPQRTSGRHRSSLGVVGLGEPPEAGRRGPGARGEGGALGRRLVGRSRSHRGLNKGGGGGCACAQRRGGGGALGESAGLVLRRPRACGGVAGGTPLRPALRSRSRAGAPYAGRARSWAFGFVKAPAPPKWRNAHQEDRDQAVCPGSSNPAIPAHLSAHLLFQSRRLLYSTNRSGSSRISAMEVTAAKMTYRELPTTHTHLHVNSE